jgi:zinc transport system ATP-binding protein
LAAKRCCHVHDLAGPKVSFKEVAFRYPTRIEPVLSDVSFCVEERSHICVIGPNGGGKTTLLKLMLGLLSPDQGTIELFGIPPHRACRHVGYVPQHSVIRPGFPITVREVVLTGCVEQHRFGWHKKGCGESADQIMEELEIAGLAGRPFSRLSGGERQRVLIARALISGPLLLLLDEPTANIDPKVQQQVRETLNRLSSRMTVITVSHDLDYISGELDGVFFVNRSVRLLQPGEVTSDAVWELFTQRK